MWSNMEYRSAATASSSPASDKQPPKLHPLQFSPVTVFTVTALTVTALTHCLPLHETLRTCRLQTLPGMESHRP